MIWFAGCSVAAGFILTVAGTYRRVAWAVAAGNVLMLAGMVGTILLEGR